MAKTAYYTVLTAFTVVCTLVGEALGGWDSALQALAAVMAVDFITGIACALVWQKSPKSKNGAFESKASLKGLLRKGAILAVIWVAYRLDVAAGTDILRAATTYFFIGNDGLSILENIGIMGVKVPDSIKKRFEALRDKGDKLPNQNDSIEFENEQEKSA